ncbi:hypothetical protein [Georgenia faecalis]|uniref:Uncharacterized protein n=1 Tax=Georgenia faecalis TaxID=2483799 RepID=A0ABV9DBG9_9MICO|nr:hypothetical protein [Georgenia faecalis]
MHAIDPHFQTELRYRHEHLHADFTRPLWWRRRAARRGAPRHS